MQPLEDAPELVDRIERITAGSLAEQLASTTPPLVVDVRSPAEWHEHRIDAAVNQPLSQFLAGLATIERGRPVVAYCGSGYRSAIAASLLQRDGHGARQRPRRWSRRMAGGEAAGHLHGVAAGAPETHARGR